MYISRDANAHFAPIPAPGTGSVHAGHERFHFFTEILESGFKKIHIERKLNVNISRYI